MNKLLIDVYNYFENHKEYGYEDIPEEDIPNIINLRNAITDAISHLEKDGRIVPTTLSTLSSILLYKAHHQYGRVEFLDKNDRLIQVIDIDGLTKISNDFYSERVEYKEFAPTDNPYRDKLVACIKFVDHTRDELKNMKK